MDPITHIRKLVNENAWDEAFPAVDQFLQEFPENLEGLTERIFMCAYYGNHQQVEEDTRTITRVAPGSAYQIFAEGAPYQLSNPHLAVDLMEHALWLDPALERAWCVLGQIHATARDFGHAARAYTQATRLDPGDIMAYAGLGLALTMTGQYREAIQALATYMSHPRFKDDLPAYQAMAHCCAMVGIELNRKIEVRRVEMSFF